MRPYSIYIPPGSRVLISARVRASEVPKDAEGRFVFQLHSSSGGGSSLPGTLVFGGRENIDQKKAKFDLDALFALGFRANNVYMTSVYRDGAPREDVFTIKVWLDQESKTLGSIDADWPVAGAHIVSVLRRGFNTAIVHENQGVLSVNLVDQMREESTPHYVLTPRMRALRTEAVKPAAASQQARTPAILQAMAPVPTAFEAAFAKAGVRTK